MRPGPGWRRGIPAAGLAAVLIAAAGTARAAEAPITIENVRVGFNDLFECGSWTPVWVDLKAGPGRFAGDLEVVVPDDDGTPTSFRRKVDVPAGQTASFSTYARPGKTLMEFVINVYEEGGSRPRASKAVSLSPPNGAMQPGQSLLLTMGHVSGIEEVSNIAGLGPEATNATNTGPQVVVTSVRGPAGIPGRWYGYDAADVIVLNTNSLEIVDALNRGQGLALEEWVRNGGHLVVAVGKEWQNVNDSILKPMLPALPRGRAPLNDLGALESFAGPNSRPIAAAGARAMTVTQLEPVEARGAHALDATAPAPLVVRGHFGFGRVTVVGLDVDQKPFTDWPDRKDFWVKVLDLRRRTVDAGAGPGMMGGGRFNNSTFNDLSSVLHWKLEQFKGITLVPFGYVAFFVFVYILLIGPGDYLFLKKVVKRMELTWVTFPSIVVVVSLLAYVAAYAVKGTELKINKVDVVDVDQSTGQPWARGTTWFTIFSPQNRDYDLAIDPLPLDRDPGAAPATKGKSSSRPQTMLSFFGAAEGNGMGGSSGMGLATSPYAYGPIGEPSVLEGVRVPIWTTKSFAGRWVGAARPVVEADLRLAGPDRLAGTVTNRLRRPLRNAALLYGKQIYKFRAELAPGQPQELGEIGLLAGELDRIRGTLPSSGPNQYQYQPADNRLTGVEPHNLVFAIMFNDAAGATGSAMASLPLRYLDLSGQLALDRPMLVAEVEGPAAALDLGRTPSPPKSEQTTVIRAILAPPAPEADEPRPAGRKG